MSGGLSLIFGKRPTTSASLGKSCSATLRTRASPNRFRIRERVCLSRIVGITSSMSMCAYQTSSTCILLNSAIRSRYDRTHAAAASHAKLSLKLLFRQARTKLAARRFMSHSHGAGSVSSKSLISKMIRLSGVAKAPKLRRWQSPQACTRSPLAGVFTRSAAMFKAAPR